MTDIGANGESSKWPHVVAVVLACATFPLIWAGGLVTTFDAGMSVPDWPTTYGYNMFLYPPSTWLFGPWDLFIEHAHRLLGSLAGILTIAFNVAVWKFDSRLWMRRLGFAALLLVISQGLLGGMRVRMDSNTFARAHGCIGPLFFALSVVMCVTTSKYWRNPAISRLSNGGLSKGESSIDGLSPTNSSSRNDLTKVVMFGGWFLFALAYVQLVFGAHLRHPNIAWTPSQFRVMVIFHLVTAVILLLQVINVARGYWNLAPRLSRPAKTLLALVVGQIALGILTWRAKYGWPTFLPVLAENTADSPIKIFILNALQGGTITAESMLQTITVTGHVALGSLILATSVLLATRATRAYCFAEERATAIRKRVSNRPEISPMVAVGATS